MQNDSDNADDRWLDEAPKAKRGWPILTTIIGFVVIIIAVANSASSIDWSRGAAFSIGQLIGGPLAAVAIIWAIAFGITYRHRGLGWRIGSAVVFLFAGAIAALGAIGSRGLAMQEEADAIVLTNERITEAAADGTIPADLPTTNGSPFQRIQAAFANDHFAEMRTFQAEVQASGLQTMLAMDGVTHSSPFLEQCGRMAAAEQLALGHRGGITRHIAAARAVGERAVAAGEMSRTDLDDVLLGMGEGDATPHDRIWTVQAETVRRSAAICRTMAQRQWETGPNGQVLFRSEAAMNSVNAELSRLQALNAELIQIQAAGRTRNAAAAAEIRNREQAR